MADTTFVIENSNNIVRAISATLDAGNDVLLKDATGNNINSFAIFLTTGGAVQFRSREMAEGEQVTLTFANGGWHVLPAHKIYAAGTDASLGLHVR